MARRGPSVICSLTRPCRGSPSTCTTRCAHAEASSGAFPSHSHVGHRQVSTIALKKISGVTHSVANTAKRAIIIVGCAIAFGESMAPVKMLGCAIAIGGTFLYAIADDLFPAGNAKKKKA